MQRFQNLLFVCQEVRKDSPALRQAVQLMQSEQAELSILIFQPEMPKELAGHKDAYDNALRDAMLSELSSLCAKEKCDSAAVAGRTKIEVLNTSPFAVEAVRNVLQKNHDVLIKDVEPVDSGLHAIDMTLLRKCPAPVWLVRSGHSDAMSGLTIAVAIDPLSEEKAGRDLAVELLQLAASMAERTSAKLRLLSCWEWKWENTVRHSAFVSLPDDELNEYLEKARADHDMALKQIVSDAGISYPFETDSQKGKADMLIPAMVQNAGVDILVMGTVARTGIPGFLIGNTAENIVQHVNCSMLTAKPNGFVSPIKAY